MVGDWRGAGVGGVHPVARDMTYGTARRVAALVARLGCVLRVCSMATVGKVVIGQADARQANWQPCKRPQDPDTDFA